MQTGPLAGAGLPLMIVNPVISAGEFHDPLSNEFDQEAPGADQLYVVPYHW
jgi:hypothetical protein